MTKNEILWFGESDIGNRRKSNQDCFAVSAELGFWLLCDGMGGHAAGAEAAARAVAVIEAEVRGGRSLLDAVAKAHLVVIELGNDLLCEDKTSRRPGTTVVALKADFAKYEIVWVGDSRAWLRHDGELELLTTDHSVVQDLINWGDLTQVEALQHPQRHQLSQALGVAGKGELRPGRVSGRWNPQAEVILLTSDGAICHEMPGLAANLLANVREPEEMVTKMISESLRRGGTLLLLTKKRKIRSQKCEDGRLEAKNREQMAQAVVRRDLDCLDLLDEVSLAALPPDLRDIALSLKERVGALWLTDSFGRRFVAASGSKQGLGRGEKWLFSFSDPRISRAPQAFLKIDGGRSFIVHNRLADNPTLVNGAEFSARPLVVGDEIALSDATRLQVKFLLADGGALLGVGEGPDSGDSLLFFKRTLSFARLPVETLRGAEAQLSAISITVQKERYLLLVDDDVVEKSKLIIRNDGFTGDLR
ncbi:MAG: protein phosphatase 2C domain-containing protein, partial [Pseudomonadota bacterium]|nr:protein phosphatase 2C domain-containing protein [Pseudomonadota bacterium]